MQPQDQCPLPLEAMIKFVRIAHIYQQKDVIEVLGEKIIQATQRSNNTMIVSRGKALQLMLAMELLTKARQCVSDTVPQGGQRRTGALFGRGGGAQQGADRRAASAISADRREDSGRLSIGSAAQARLSPLMGATRRLKKLSESRKSPKPGVKGHKKAGGVKKPGSPMGKRDALSASLGVLGRSGGSRTPTAMGGKASSRGGRGSRKLSGGSDKASDSVGESSEWVIK